MNQNLENRLHALADGLEAPATPGARTAIGQRARVLRRRRQIATAGGGGVLTVALVAGAMALQGTGAPDVEVGPAEDPGCEVDTVSRAYALFPEIDPVPKGTVQLFGPPEGDDGPQIAVHHVPATDAVVPEGDTEVNGHPADLYTGTSGQVVLDWDVPELGDTTASVEACGLAEDAVLRFAESLEPVGTNRPQGPDQDDFGFEVTWLPDDMVELTTP